MDHPFPDVLTLKLEHVTFRNTMVLPRHTLRMSRRSLASCIDSQLERMVFDLECELLRQRLEDREHTVVFDVPATWVDHLRKRLGWKYRTKQLRQTVRFHVAADYPEANVIPRTLGKPVLVSYLDTPGPYLGDAEA
jgi:hypothetical protein